MNREKPKPIQLLFTADEHYAVRIPTVLKSLQLSHPGRSSHIHLICDGLSEPAAAALRDACERMGFALFLYPVSEELFSDAPITKHYSKAMGDPEYRGAALLRERKTVEYPLPLPLWAALPALRAALYTRQKQ